MLAELLLFGLKMKGVSVTVGFLAEVVGGERVWRWKRDVAELG